MVSESVGTRVKRADQSHFGMGVAGRGSCHAGVLLYNKYGVILLGGCFYFYLLMACLMFTFCFGAFASYIYVPPPSRLLHGFSFLFFSCGMTVRATGGSWRRQAF